MRTGQSARQILSLYPYLFKRLLQTSFHDCIFIGGAPHSGTSIITRMLSSHSQVFTPSDEMYIPSQAFPRNLHLLQHLLIEKTRSKKQVLVEKTPTNLMNAGNLRKIAPGCQFIFLLRDYRDVLASQKRRNQKDLYTYVHEWIEAAHRLLDEHRKPDVLVIRYENFVEDPEAELKRICNFIDLRFEEGMLNYHEHAAHWFGQETIRKGSGIGIHEHRALRNWQINQPLFDGRGRWVRELSTSDLDLLERSGAQRLAEELNHAHPTAPSGTRS